jgi:hypothetical protein
MVFTGHAHSNARPDDIDIFIAQSTDGGVNFSGDGINQQFDGYRVVRLTDQDLGDDGLNPAKGAVQFFPSIAVDQWGTLHVMYYVGWWAPPTCDNCEGGPWMYKVKLAHIPNFNVSQTLSVSTVDLTSYSFTLNDPSIDRTLDGWPWIGDYMNSLDVRGCQVIGGTSPHRKKGAR